ncbi:hypothetical protein [Plantactinospora sonchi]|uniref:DUF202 domain-containing protein n=1 Tax=Plantactinospora sonchi TaxID=1544735 RepID=A0ABU7RU41_9ACTN
MSRRVTLGASSASPAATVWIASIRTLALTLDRVVRFLYRGRDISWLQTVHLYPAFTLLLAVGTLACLVVVAVRVFR